MKKIIFLIIIIQIFACSIVNANESINLEEKKMNYEKVTLATKIANALKDEAGNYPDYFGGMYISNDSRNLIIQVVKKYLPIEGTKEFYRYKNIIEADLSIIVHQVDYSYNELLKINEIVSNEITSNDSNVIGNGIIFSKNSIELDVLNSSSKLAVLNKIKKYSNNNSLNDHIILNETANIEYNDAPATISAGEKIIVKDNKECSMGFRTKYKGKTGFVTAGHCVELGATYYSGKVIKVQFKNNEKYDYAFVETKSWITPLNALYFTAGIHQRLAVANFSPIYVENASIASSGNKSGVTYGKIIKLNCTVDGELSDGTRVITKGMIKADYKTKHGASGAPVFWEEVKNGESVPIGINSSGVYPAGSDINGYSTYSYFTGINELPDEMKMGRY